MPYVSFCSRAFRVEMSTETQDSPFSMLALCEWLIWLLLTPKLSILLVWFHAPTRSPKEKFLSFILLGVVWCEHSSISSCLVQQKKRSNYAYIHEWERIFPLYHKENIIEDKIISTSWTINPITPPGVFYSFLHLYPLVPINSSSSHDFFPI